MNLTGSTKPVSAKEIQRKLVIIDVTDKVLGRVSTEIVDLLTGKRKVNYVPYLDMGDTVVIINASKVKVTGKKMQTKEYDRYSGYPGGRTTMTMKELMERKPEDIIRNSVSGMLPKNKLRKQRMARLFIYSGDQHPYQNQA